MAGIAAMSSSPCAAMRPRALSDSAVLQVETEELLHELGNVNVYVKRTFVELGAVEEASDASTVTGASSRSSSVSAGDRVSDASAVSTPRSPCGISAAQCELSVPPGNLGVSFKSPKEDAVGRCGSKAWGKKRAPAESNYTTLVVKGLERCHNNLSFKELLDAFGLRGQYNFLYVPMDFNTGESYGYGFVNFVAHSVALEALQVLEGRRAGAEALEADWSLPHQGYAVHVRRYQNSPVMHASVADEFRPMIFRRGVQQPFPKPTKKIREPRLRRGCATEGTALERTEASI